jgi:hypothetical protein
MRRLAGVVAALSAASVLLVGCGSDDEQSTAGLAHDDDTASSGPVTAAPAALNADHLMAGTATGLEFPAGKLGEVSVVEAGPLESDGYGHTLPFLFRNNTDASVSHVDVSATARNKSGDLVTTGTSQGTTPAQVPPGGLGFAYIYFDGEAAPPPPDASYAFTFDTSPADQSSYNTGDVRITEAAVSGRSIVGTARNDADATMAGPYSADVACFDRSGALLATVRSYANEDGDLAPGDRVSFTVDLYDQKCPKYVVGVTGFFS